MSDIIAIAARVGKDKPQLKETSKGNVLEFAVVQTDSYEQGSRGIWYDVSVWDESLQDYVNEQLGPSAEIAIVGRYSTRESGGRVYNKLTADRIGRVEYAKRGPKKELPF